MSLSLGNTTIGSLYLGSTKIGAAYFGNAKVYQSGPAIPERTFRLTCEDGYDLSQESALSSAESITQVSSSPNVWDVRLASYSYQFLSLPDKIISIVANLQGFTGSFSSAFAAKFILEEAVIYIGTGISNLTACFSSCSALENLTLVGGSNVTNYGSMCSGCSSLKTVPHVDTTSATNVTAMFLNCSAVESGALALYQQMSSQTTPPSSYADCFSNCGSNTVTGAAELAQIPSSWGGTGA